MANASVFLIVLAFCIVIPICLGVYVWRDARRRGMNAAVWVVLAIFAPACFGLLLYLLARMGRSNLVCPSCGGPVREEFVICPHCATRLKATCSCGAPLEHGWIVCPHCAQACPEPADFTPPVRPKDGLWKLLLTLVIIPAVLLVLIALTSYTSFTASLSTLTDSLPEYLTRDDRDEAVAWLEACIADGTQEAYALHYDERSGDKCATTYLVYLPHSGELRVEAERRATLFGAKIEVAYTQNTGIPMTGSLGEQRIVFVTAYSDRFCDLEVTVGGVKLDVAVTDAVRNPAPFAVHGDEYATP